jgi:hypothetical protein
MAGNPRHIIRDPKIDNNYLSYINNLSSGGNTTNVTSSKDTIKQYVKTKNGIFNGAFGSVGQALAISSGTLDLTANSTGAVVVRRMIYVMPESGTSDTIDNIEINGLELPYQELTLMSSTGNTITIAHNSSGGGTTKNIYCPGDTDYVLAPNEAVKLIYDSINTIWLVTGSGGSSADNLGNHTATTNLNMSGNQIQQITTAFFNGDIDNANSIAGNTGGLDYNVDDTDEIHDFQVDGVSKFTVGDTQINMIAHLSMSGKTIYLDSDVDTTISSFSDDSIQIGTGGTIRLSITNTAVIATGNLTTLGNLTVSGGTILGDASSDTVAINGTLSTDIEMGGNDLDFATGGTVDFHDIDSSTHSSGGAPALPAQPTAYFVVKYQGGTRYIPYYS